MKRSDTQALFFALAILCICVHFVHQCQCFTKPIQMGETAPLQPSKYFVADSVHVFYYKDPQTRLHYESTPWTTEERDALIKIVDERDVPIDWSEVASQMGSKKPMDCFIQYDNVDNPANNKGQWSFDEDKKIAELVTKFDEHEWCNIAEELSTNRTPYECLRHYQQHMNTKLINSNEWTAEEDEMLKSAVEQYGLGQWQAVSSCIPGRSSIQCMSRWKKASCHDNLVNGKWLPEEEKLLFLAALSYGAPRMSDSKKSEVELQSLFSKAGIAFDGTESLPMQNGEQVATTNAIFTRWLDIAALVPGK